MLEATSRTAIAYCHKHGLSYESYIGIKRGFYGCHATFNRMFMLTELLERNWSGWVLYMDADAYFYDLNFDLRDYLQGKADHAAVMATIDGQLVPWHINAGVLMFNLGHEVCRHLLYDWKNRFMALDEDRLRALTSVWGDDNDQSMLCSALYEHPEWRDAIYFEQAIKMNHVEGHFIRQYLGAFDQDIESRTDTVERLVMDVLLRHDLMEASAKDDVAVLKGLYRAALARDPDPIGLAGYLPTLASEGRTGGIERVLNSLLDSPEGQNHARSRYSLAETSL